MNKTRNQSKQKYSCVVLSFAPVVVADGSTGLCSYQVLTSSPKKILRSKQKVLRPEGQQVDHLPLQEDSHEIQREYDGIKMTTCYFLPGDSGSNDDDEGDTKRV